MTILSLIKLKTMDNKIEILTEEELEQIYGGPTEQLFGSYHY